MGSPARARKASLIAAPLAALAILGAACTDSAGNLREAVTAPPTEDAPEEPAAASGGMAPAPDSQPPREQDAPPQEQPQGEDGGEENGMAVALRAALSIAALSLCGEEYVEIANGGDAAVSLSGWSLQDAAGAEREIPAAMLEPGASVRVYTGDTPEDAPEGALTLERRSPLWNDDGDTATLLDTDGGELDSRSADDCLAQEADEALMMMEMETPTVTTPAGGGDLRITEVAASGDEYIVLTNADTEPIQLLGWVLRDSTERNRLIIEAARLLKPGESVRIYNNSLPAGAPAGSIAASGQRRVWNDGGDTVRLLGPDGGEVQRIAYTGNSWSAAGGGMESEQEEGEQAGGGQTGMLEIVSVDARAEIVVIRNADDEAVNLSGWLLRDSTERNRLRLPSHTLEPGGQVRVYSREVPPGAPAGAIAGEGIANIWNNDGDTVRLIDPSGSQIDRVEYTGAAWPEPRNNDRVVSPPSNGNRQTNPPPPVITYPTTLEITVVSPCRPEYVGLRNTGTAAVQLQNWVLRDDSPRNRLTLPQHSLAPAAEVRVYTRQAPTGTVNTISIERGQGIWNDGETDTANLLNPAGARLTSVTFNGCLRTEEEEQQEPMEMKMEADTMTAVTRTYPHAPHIAAVQARDEYITLRNAAATDINLQGWMLRDESSSNLLTLPEHTLEQGKEVRAYTSSVPADAPAGSIAATGRNNVWNVDGDTVILLDPNGMERDRVEYTGEAWSIDDAMGEEEEQEMPMEEDMEKEAEVPDGLHISVLELCGGTDNHEYVEITNGGSEAVDLDGWKLQDAANNPNELTLPSRQLASGATVRIYTGALPDDAPDGAIAIGHGNQIWNNDGDTAKLLTPSGNQVHALPNSQCAR